MAKGLFLFTQLELPWELGPLDGRYLVRSPSDGEPEWVVVLGTVAGARASARPGAFGRGPRRNTRRRSTPASPDPALVATSRATMIDPLPVSAEHQARAWLSELDTAHEVGRALAVLNRLLHAHRIAAADPYVHEVSAEQALVIRLGFGEGEVVAEGRWKHALQVPAPQEREGRRARRARRGREAVLRPQERLTELLGGREAGLVCEELALRARLDLDQGRTAHAAVGLSSALDAALRELAAEERPDLALRIDELAKLRPGVRSRIGEALGADVTADEPQAGAQQAQPTPEGGEEQRVPAGGHDDYEQVMRHALERLESALRARTAPGFRR